MDRGKRGSGSTVVWKYIFAGCIIIYTALVFVYMSGSNRPFKYVSGRSVSCESKKHRTGKRT